MRRPKRNGNSHRVTRNVVILMTTLMLRSVDFLVTNEMPNTRRHVTLLLALLTIAGCNGRAGTAVPTAPTSAAIAPTVVPVATIRGVVSIQTTGSGNAASAPAGARVSVLGTNFTAPIAVDGAFALVGVPAGDVQLRFEGAGLDATLAVGVVQPDQVLDLVVTVSGSVATIDQTQRSSSSQVEVKGIVTVVTKNGTCSDLLAGSGVEVKGVLANGRLIAAEVEIDHVPTANPQKLKGPAAGVSGTCGVPGPMLSFRVHGMPVTVDANTVFKKGACSDIKNGTDVEVKGFLMSGVVVAKEVEVD